MTPRSTRFVSVCILSLFLVVALGGTVNVYAKSGIQNSPDVKTLSSPLGEYFGATISSAGGYVAVGAPFETPYQTTGSDIEAGKVYVYSQSSGSLLYTLTSPDPQYQGYFGDSLSAGYGILVVGAPGETSGGYVGAGNAYVFKISTGDLISSLTSDFPQEDGYFGLSVAAGPVYHIGVAAGNLVMVGAPGEDAICGDGRAWTFIAEGANGVVDNSYCSPNPVSDGQFGDSVAIGGGYMAVGAPLENSGFVYTYNAKSGLPIGTISSPNAQADGWFGYSVAMSTNGILAVGAPGENDFDGNAYTFAAWSDSLFNSFTLTGSRQDGEWFGESVAIGESKGTFILIVGAPLETVSGDSMSGQAYTFNALGGSMIKVYTSPNNQPSGGFGQAVAISGKTASVGAPFEDNDTGNAYIF